MLMAQKQKAKLVVKAAMKASAKPASGKSPAGKPVVAKALAAKSRGGKTLGSKTVKPAAKKIASAKSKEVIVKKAVKPAATKKSVKVVAAKVKPVVKSQSAKTPVVAKVKATAKDVLAAKASAAKASAVKSVAKPAVKVAAAKVQPAKPATHAAANMRPAVPASAIQAQRAVPASIGKPAGQKITAPAPVAAASAAAPVTPKALAEKAVAARGMMAAQKKPVSVRHGFKTNEFVVYPAHGVGRIVGIEEQEIAGMSLELFVITFDKEKLTLRVPTGKLASIGMRKLAEESVVKRAMETLKGRARVKRTMWSRRAQEYVAKINSGDLISIAEVVRDLYRSEAQPEQSYSERQLYENALERMARELAAVERLDERGASQRIVEILSKSAKGRRLAAEGLEAAEAADTKAA